MGHPVRWLWIVTVAAALLGASVGMAGERPRPTVGPGGLPSLDVPVTAAAGRAGALVTVELLDLDDAVRAATRRPVGGAGSHALVPLSFLGDLPPSLQAEIATLRLRVSLTAGGSTLARWIVPAGRLPGAFQLTVIDPEVVRLGERIPVFVLATEPATGRPVPGVEVTARLGDTTVRGRTGARGALPLWLPPLQGGPTEQTETSYHLEGVRGPFRWTVEPKLYGCGDFQLADALDRPLCRPGETVHAWVYLADGDGAAMPGERLQLRVENARGDELFATEAVTDGDGVATADVPVPSDMPPGRLRVEVASDRLGFTREVGEVRVTTMELPPLLLTAQVENGWILQGGEARIRIETRTPSGRPAAGVPVAVGREGDGWGWEEPGERTFWRGRTGASGTARAVLPWDELGLKPLSAYFRFRDVKLVVRAGDPASGRSVHRPLWLRVSRQRLHVYADDTVLSMPGRPSSLLVTTWRPDGSPAAARVTVRTEDGVVGRGRTGPEGIGRVVLQGPVTEGPFELRAVAEDGAEGDAGAWAASFRVGAWVVPSDPLPARGEPLRLTVYAARRGATVLLQVRRDDELLIQRTVVAGPGGTRVEIPWRPELAGVVWVAAVDPSPGLEDLVAQSAPVAYPTEPVQLELSPVPADTTPGATVRITARLRRADQPVAGRLTLAGVDEAALAAVAGTSGMAEPLTSFARAVERDLVPPEPPADPRRIVESLGRSAAAARLLSLLAEAGQQAWVGQTSKDLNARLAARYRKRMQRQLALGADGPRYRRALEAACPGPGLPAVDQVLGTLTREGWPGAEAVDPWGHPYRFHVELSRRRFILSARSTGDGGERDGGGLVVPVAAWRWLAGLEPPLEKAVYRLLEDRGPAGITPETVTAQLRSRGVDVERVLDPWGRPLRVTVGRRGATVEAAIVSDGPVALRNGKRAVWDDIRVAKVRLDTLGPVLARLRAAIAARLRGGGRFPGTPAELEEVLGAAGLDRAGLVDALGRPVRMELGVAPRWGDTIRVDEETVKALGVTARVPEIRFYAAGRDGKPGTADDVQVARLSASTVAWDTGAPAANCTGRCGTLVIQVVDEEEQPLPGVTLVVSRVGAGSLVRTAVTGAEGTAAFALPAGSYDVAASLPGYQKGERRSVPVTTSQTTAVHLQIHSALREEVLVKCEASLRDTAPPPSGPPPRLRTPRLRKDFATSCLWVPHLETDAAGRAAVPVTLPDDQTTWRIEAVALTADGAAVTAHTEVRAALPLEARLELPPRLTVGDRVRVRASVRNTTEDGVRVQVRATASGALRLEGSAGGESSIAAGGVGRWEVPVAALRPGGATVRLAASTTGPGDAIERRTVVEPLGRPGSTAAGAAVRERATLTLTAPGEALAGTVRLRVTAFPGMAARVRAALERMLRLPAWCGEQRASRGLLALTLLRLAPTAPGARRTVARALRAVRDLQTGEGGFPYFAGERPDPVLTAYTLRFLEAARKADFHVEGALDRARLWLQRSQRSGLWDREGAWSEPEHVTLTVLRNLAEAGWGAEAMVRAGLAAMEPRIRGVDDPWVLASWALAVGPDTARAAGAVQRLVALAREERGGVYWAPRHNLPLGGWGLAGRIETTALVLRALRGAGVAPELCRRGLRFLDRNGARGVWWTSPATVAVIETLAGEVKEGKPGGAIGIVLDGRSAGRLELPEEPRAPGPLRWEAGPLAPGTHTIELVREGGTSPVPVDAELRYVTPWPREGTAEEQGASGDLALSVHWPSDRLRLGRPVTVRAHAGRSGSPGFGMLLAEIGLGPGMEVDASTCRPTRCEVEPGTVRFYLWPKPGGTDLSFRVRPTLAGSFHTLPSRLSSFYDPTAALLLPPPPLVVEPAGDPRTPAHGGGAGPLPASPEDPW